MKDFKEALDTREPTELMQFFFQKTSHNRLVTFFFPKLGSSQQITNPQSTDN